jgi:DNA-binding YbaB/EbfC family protein
MFTFGIQYCETKYKSAMGFFDQMKQMMEMKQQMEEVKKRLDAIEIDAANDFVKVTVNGNRKVKDISILRNDDKLLLESAIQNAVNEAMEKADGIMQAEFSSVAKGMFPNLPGM